MTAATDRFAKLSTLGKQTPFVPLAHAPVPQPKAGLVARLSVSLPPSEAEHIEVLAKEAARATGDKPTQSELVRAGLVLLASLPLADRLAALGRLPKVR